MLLEERIKQIVRQVLNEELSINQTVVNTSLEIIDDIVNHVSNGEYKLYNITPRNKIPHKILIFNHRFLNDKIIRIHSNVYEFETFDDLISLKNDNLAFYKKIMSSRSNTQTEDYKIFNLYLNIIYVNNEIIPHVFEVAQHEVEHIFQMSMKKGQLIRKYTRYKKANDNVKSEDKLISMIGYLEYAKNNFEIDAVANGIYAFLKHTNCSLEEIDNVIRKSTGYRVCNNIRNIRKTLFYLKDSKSANDKVISNFNFTIDVAIKHCEHTLHNLLQKIGKIKTLYLKENGYE